MRGTGHDAPGTHTRTPARDVPQPGGQTGGLSVHGRRGCRRWGSEALAGASQLGWGWFLSARDAVSRRQGPHLQIICHYWQAAEVCGGWWQPEGGQSHPGHRWRAPASPHWETEGETEARGSLSWSGTVEGWRARLPMLAAVQWEMGLCRLHLPQGHASPPVSLQGGATQCQRFGDELTSEREPGRRQAESRGEREAGRLGGRGPSPAQQLSMAPQCLLNNTGAGIPAFAQGVPAPA